MSTPFAPIRVRTLTSRRRVEASAFDCVRFVVVRDGSFLIDCASQVEPIGVGDVVVVAPPTVVGYEPEGNAIVTTLFADTDYLIEHLFLQHLDLIPDRDAARDLAAKLYPDPVQVLHLGEREVERLGPVLDELVSRTEATQDAAGYFRTQAHLLTVLEAVAPARPSRTCRGAAHAQRHHEAVGTGRPRRTRLPLTEPSAGSSLTRSASAQSCTSRSCACRKWRA